MLKKVIFFICALAGLVIFLSLFDKVFPTASLDLRVSRTQAVQMAEEYVEKMGYDTQEYRSSVTFSGDSTKFVFIEKNLGLEKANEIVRESIPIWSWNVRFFRELEKEEFRVAVNPNGRIDGFAHYINDTAAGEDLTKDQAQKLAQEFLKTNDVDYESYELVRSSSRKRENRTDHSFEWKNENTAISWAEGDADDKGTERISLRVQGGKVGSYRAYFFTPEKFNRSLKKLFSEGRFLALISSFFYMLLYVAGIVMFIISFKAKPLSFKLMFGVVLLIGIPNLLNIINSLPLLLAGYDTKQQLFVFIGSGLISSVKGIINHIIVILIVFCAGYFVTDQVYPKRISGLLNFFDGKAERGSVTGEILGGYVLAFILLGFVTLFYYFTMKYAGVWVFPSPRYSNVLGTWFPFLLPLSLSLVAAVSEEFIFRMFAISFLKKYLRVTFIAVLIPALIWAFAHSSYAVFPVYTRGIELTIVAFAFSFVFLRYGILACIIAHYVVDAVLFSVPLLRSSNTYFVVAGFVVILLALLPVIYSFFKNRFIVQKQ